MLNKTLKVGNKFITCNIMIEGPYGSSEPHLRKTRRKYVYVAGGLGTTAVSPHFVELYQVSTSDELKQKLIWVIDDSN